MSSAASLEKAAAAREARRAAFLALMPVAVTGELAAEWQRLAEVLADDPPAWSPSRRYSDLLHEYCVETCQVRRYREVLKTPHHEVYREKSTGGADRVKVHPYVALLDAALGRLRELTDMLDLSPRARKKRGSPFDAA